MLADYFHVRFRRDLPAVEPALGGAPRQPAEPCDDWPEHFAIITAYATTGQRWTDERNAAADDALRVELRESVCWMRRLTGYSPSTGHAEPGWAAELPFATACDWGWRFHQDAIYYVDGDLLSVSYCDARRRPIPVGPFRQRVD